MEKLGNFISNSQLVSKKLQMKLGIRYVLFSLVNYVLTSHMFSFFFLFRL